MEGSFSIWIVDLEPLTIFAIHFAGVPSNQAPNIGLNVVSNSKVVKTIGVALYFLIVGEDVFLANTSFVLDVGDSLISMCLNYSFCLVGL